mgnify:CR=1 FL=1
MLLFTRAIVDDGRRNCAVIPNENFADTYVPRDEHQSLADRNKYGKQQTILLGKGANTHPIDSQPWCRQRFGIRST